MEENKKEMSSDEVAELLVQLYADYKIYSSELNYHSENPNYAMAVAIAIRMLSD